MSTSEMNRRSLLKGATAAAVGAATLGTTTAAASPGKLTFFSRRSAQEQNTVVYWQFGGVPSEIEFRRQQTVAFTEQTGIPVDFQERPWENQRQDILAALTGGDLPDVMNLHHKYVGEFGETGDLQALEEFPDYAEVAGRFVPQYLDALKQGDNHYGLPINALPFILAVNQPMLDAASVSVPTNWDEFKQTAQALTNAEAGVYGYTIPGGVNLDSAYRWVPWLYKAGGRVLNDDWSEATFNDEAGVAALQMLLDLQGAGAIPPGNAAYAFQENSDLWGTEKAAMTTEGPWWPGVMRDTYSMDLAKLTVAPVPAQAQPVGANPPGTLVDIIMLAIMSRGNNTEGAWELVKFMRTAEADIAFINETNSGLPTTTAAFEDETGWDVIGRETYAQEAQSAVIWPNHPQISEIQMAIATGLNAAFSGTASAQEALDGAAEEVSEILEG